MRLRSIWKKLRPTGFSAGMIVAVVVCVALIALGVWLIHWKSFTSGSPGGISLTAAELSVPSESPIVSSKYTVPADQPKYIRIPAVHVDAPIQRVGLTKNDAVGAPDNVFVAGWFTSSVLPGSKGLSIIDGHVQGRTIPGVFKNLGNLQVGDTFLVVFGNDSQKRFEVMSVKSYNEKDAAAALFNQDPSITSQLSLITCAGEYVSAQKTYDQRLIVTSKLVQ